MNKKETDYLLDLLQELTDVAEFTVDGEAAFMRDKRTQKAVIRSYEVIGEIAKRLTADFRAANSQIDWHKLITFRDFLAHNYELIALRYVWEAVKDLPNLKAAVESMLRDMENTADKQD